MPAAATQLNPDALLAELERLPEHVTGEVIAGTLYTMGRPSLAHQHAEGQVYGRRIIGGPGGTG